MDPASLAAGLATAGAGQTQQILAAKMMKMNAEAAQSVVATLDAAQQNLAPITRPPGMGALRHSRLTGRSPPQRRLDQLHGIIARPFGRTSQDAEFAAARIDQQRRRHAERLSHRLEVLERLGARIGIIG